MPRANAGPSGGETLLLLGPIVSDVVATQLALCASLAQICRGQVKDYATLGADLEALCVPLSEASAALEGVRALRAKLEQAAAAAPQEG